MSATAATTELTSQHPTSWGVFLFTDLEGSTKAWEDSAPQMHEVLAEHDRILRDAFAEHGGSIFSWAGDAFATHFPTIPQAVGAAVGAQHALAAATWPDGWEPGVRMGIHAGVAYQREDNWFGPCLNRAARIMSAGHGGQILASRVIVEELSADRAADLLVDPMGPHRLKDLPEPVNLWQISAAGLTHEFPPLTSVQGPTHRIPRARTSFVGRTDDQDRLLALMADHQLVTIVAAGGTGKTRLAFESAHSAAADYSGGTFVVELADAEPAGVGYAFGGAVLGDDPLARIEGASDPIRAVVKHLARRRALLVVDNCEHVAEEAAAAIDAITGSCHAITVLSTSRVPLGLSGEQVMWLAPLEVDSADGPAPTVELFIDRATVARSDLPLDHAQLEAISSICKMLDGSPLGVELAAARTKAWLPTELVGHLDQSLRVLRDPGGADRPDRHRSLEATISWSFDQLNSVEQDLIQFCSVFAGGFDMAAVASLGQQLAGLDEIDVLDAVEMLIDNSLVTATSEEGATRYRLSEPIRQFAHARLEEAGRVEEAHVSHIDWYHGLARSHVAGIDEAPDPVLINRLRLEHDNFIAAISRAVQRDDLATARRLTVSLHTYWEESGYVSTGARLLKDLVGMGHGGAPGDEFRAVLMQPAGAQAAGLLTTYSAMAGELARAELLAAELGFLLEVDLPPKASAALAFTLGFVDRAAERVDSCLRLWTMAGDAALAGEDFGLARQALWSAAYGAAVSSRYGEARDLLDRAREVPLENTGWFPHLANMVDDSITLLEQDPDEADVAGILEQVDRDARAVDDLGLRFRTLLSAASTSLVMYRCGNPDGGHRWWQRGLEVGHDMGHLWGCWVMLEFTGWTLEDDGRPLEAAEVWGAVDEFGRRNGYRRWRAIDDNGTWRRERARAVDPAAFDAAWERGGKRRGLSELVNANLA